MQNENYPGIFSTDYLRRSLAQFKSLRSLVAAALLCAVAVVLEKFNLHLSEALQVSLSFLPIMLCSALTGPLVAIPCGVIVDVLGFLIGGYPFFPGYTLTAVLTATVYALFLYAKKISFPRLAAAKLFINVFINTLLGSFWRLHYYDHPFLYSTAVSGVKNLLLFPLEVWILCVFFAALAKPLNSMGYRISLRDSLKINKKRALLLCVFGVLSLAVTLLLVFFYNDLKTFLEFLK